MRYANRSIDRTRPRSKVACLGGAAALLTLSALLTAGPAQAESRRVDLDCREGLTKKVVLWPDQDSVEIIITGCMCAWPGQSAATLKERLKAKGAAQMAAAAQGEPAIFPAGGLPVYTFPVAQGEKKDITISCYTPGQVSEYLTRAEQAVTSD